MEPIGACISAINKGWEFISNFRSLESDMGKLRMRMDELSAREEDVMKVVEKEEAEQGKKRKREVNAWQKNVKRIKYEASSIEEKFRAERWFWAFCRRPILRKNIEDLRSEVVRLKQEGVFQDGVTIEPLVSGRSPQPTATLVGESANTTLTKIWNLILDVEIKKVGVFGMAGVGKSTIMRHIHNDLLKLHVFENIIWVTVSKALDLHRLQCEIANIIQLDLSKDCGDNEEHRASKIYAALLSRGRCLLILDDLWDSFSLDRIGIPEPTQTNGCKLVITSRSFKVCTGMESDRTVEVKILSDDEAWHLFKEKVGDCVLGCPQIEPIAKGVVKECGCLPLALITVGRALRQVDDFNLWRIALDELKGSCADIHGMDGYVFPRLLFSYNRLRNDTLRGCFLYCALYPEDYEIYTKELIENWMWEGLIDEVGDRKKAKDKGYKILNELIDACMIEDSSSKRYVKLHDLIRDLAINITKTNPRFMVKAGEKLKESPRVEEWTEDTMRVSLMNNKIEVLSGQPMCPALCTLLLQGNECLREISNSYFECIRGLKFLDLSRTLIESLPEQISELEELRVLKLNDCWQLKKLPSVAKLKQLRVLQLAGLAIEELPQGMEELGNLRCLDLSHTRNLRMLPAGLISNLSVLEEFMMVYGRWKWASKGTEEGPATADVKEIESLARLAKIGLSFEDVQGFNNFARSEKLRLLEGFVVTLGKTSRPLSLLLRSGKKVTVDGHGGMDVLSHSSFLMLPHNTESLQILNCENVSRLSQLSWPENLKVLWVCDCRKMKSLLTIGLLQYLRNLETIDVLSCDSMEDIVADDGNVTINNFSFSKLKTLHLSHLKELKSIWNTGFSCPSLELVFIWHCPQLKKLPFTSHNLPGNLKELGVNKEWWDALEWEDSIARTSLQGLLCS